MTHLRKKWASKHGGALLVAMGMIFLVGATTSGLFYQGLIHSKFGERTLAQTRALELANSGIELARYTLRHSASDCFSTEIAKPTLFDQVPLGTDGYFTVEVLANVNDPYSVRVVSTGKYIPSATTSKVESKMTCGYLSAMNKYSIVTAGDLFVTGAVTTDPGDYTYNEIHADGSITFFSTVEVPETGLSITQVAPIATVSPEGAAINQGVPISQTTTPSGMQNPDGSVFAGEKKADGSVSKGQMSDFYREYTGTKNFFQADGSVTDASGALLRSACSSPCNQNTVHTYAGYAYTPAPPPGIPSADGNPIWKYTGTTSLAQNTTYVFQNTNLKIGSEVGSALNPSKVTFVVEDGNLEAEQAVHLAKQDTMGNKTARSIGMIVDGSSHFMRDLQLTNTTLVNGGKVDVEGKLNLENAALIASSDVELTFVDFTHSYDGSPIVHNEETHGNMLKMKAEQTEYVIGNPTTAPVASSTSTSGDGVKKTMAEV